MTGEQQFTRGLQYLQRGRPDLAMIQFKRAAGAGVNVAQRLQDGATAPRQKIHGVVSQESPGIDRYRMPKTSSSSTGGKGFITEPRASDPPTVPSPPIVIPAPPDTGTWFLGAIDGVLTWIDSTEDCPA